MSELRQQVSRFREENLVVAPVYANTPSLFLNKKDAGSVDMDTVFDAGLAGLQALSQYDERFSSYMDNIFHLSSQSVQRDLLSPEETKVLNKRISDFLRLLTLFAGEPSAHKVLEYLVRRYRVHELNADALLKCMIAQHDTKIFARVVQLSKIDNTIWVFLSTVQASGSPLTRATLAKRCRKDIMLLTALTSLTLSAVRTGNASHASTNISMKNRSAVSAVRGAEAVLSFYTATVVEVLEAAHTVSEAQLRVLYPFLIGGLGGEVKSDGDEQVNYTNINTKMTRYGLCTAIWKKASCMLVSEVVRLVQLGKPLVKSLIDTIASSLQSARSLDYGVNTDTEDLLMAFTMLAQYQEVVCTPSVLKKLFFDDLDMTISTDILNDLEALASNYNADVTPVIASVLQGTVTSLSLCVSLTATGSSNSNNNISNAAQETANLSLSPKELGVIFLRVSAAGLVNGDVVVTSMTSMLVAYVVWESKQHDKKQGKKHDKKQKEESSGAGEYRTTVEDILRFCSQRHPAEFDTVVQATTTSFSTSEAGEEGGGGVESQCLSALLKRVFEKSPYKLPNGKGVGMLLGLSHASSKLRIEALNLFATSVPLSECSSESVSSDVIGLCSAASANFDMSSELKVLVAASQKDVLSKVVCVLSTNIFFESLQNVFNVWFGKLSISPKQSRSALVAILTGVFDASVLVHIATTPTAVDTLILHLISVLQQCRYNLPRTEKAGKYCRNIVTAVSAGFVNLSQYSTLLTNCDGQILDSLNDIDEICDECWTQLSTTIAKNSMNHATNNANSNGSDSDNDGNGSGSIQALLGLYESLKRGTVTSEGNVEFVSRLSGLIVLLTSVCQNMIVIAGTDTDTITTATAKKHKTKTKNNKTNNNKENTIPNDIVHQTFSVLMSWISFYYERSCRATVADTSANANDMVINCNTQVDDCLAATLRVFPKRADVNDTHTADDDDDDDDIVKNKSMSSICSLYLEGGLVAADIKARLLACLLDLMSADADRCSPLIGLCLQTFYASSSAPIKILAQISSSSSSSFESTAAEEEEGEEGGRMMLEEVYSNELYLHESVSMTSTTTTSSSPIASCVVSSNARTSALFTLSAYLRYIIAAETQADEENSNSDHDNGNLFSDILSLIPAVVSCLGDVSDSIRVAAMTVIDELCNLAPGLTLVVEGDTSTTTSTALGGNKKKNIKKKVTTESISYSCNSSLVVYLAHLFKRQSGSIVVDEDIASQVMSNDIFQQSEDNDGNGDYYYAEIKLELAHLFLHFAVALGWKSPRLSNFMMGACLQKSESSVTWPWVKTLLLAATCDSDSDGDSDGVPKGEKDDDNDDEVYVKALGIILLRVATWNITEQTSPSEKQDVITTLCSLLPSRNVTSLTTQLRSLFFSELSLMGHVDNSAPRWMDCMDEACRVQLYSSITAQMCGGGGGGGDDDDDSGDRANAISSHSHSRDDFVSSLQAISVPVRCAYDSLVLCQTTLQRHLASFEARGYAEMEMDDDNEEEREIENEDNVGGDERVGSGVTTNTTTTATTTLGAGMVLPLQYMCMYLDSVTPVLQAASRPVTISETETDTVNNEDFVFLSKSAVTLMDILVSLNIPEISTVLTIGYCRGLLLELACTCLSKISTLIPSQNQDATSVVPGSGSGCKGSLTNGKSKKAVGRKSKKSIDESEAGTYTHTRVNSDIEAIFQCLQLSSTSYVQTFSLRLLDVLLSLLPSAVDKAVQALSQVLATATFTTVTSTSTSGSSSDGNVDSKEGNISCVDTNGLVGGIVRTTTAIRARKCNTDNNNSKNCIVVMYPQEVLQPLYSNFSIMTFDKRLSLMKIAFQEFDDNALPISVALVLAHSLAVHGTFSSQGSVSGSSGKNGKNGKNKSLTKRKSNADADVAEDDNGDVFILLSRSAQRKANASRKVSESEELFNLATKASFLKPTNVQMQSLVVLTRLAKNLMSYLIKGDGNIDLSVFDDEEDEEEEEEEEEEVNVDSRIVTVTGEDEMLTQMDKYNAKACKCVFNLSHYVTYANKLLQLNVSDNDDDKDSDDDDDGDDDANDGDDEDDENDMSSQSDGQGVDSVSNGAALLVLLMEYILEFVENTKFHDSIIATFEHNNHGDINSDGHSRGSEMAMGMGEEVQRLFLVLCEQLLELLAFTTHIQHTLARSKRLLPIRLGGVDNGQKNMDVRPSHIAKRVWMLSLDAIHAIQRLLDGPTFIVILQELINHDHISVRQKSLQILSDRLQRVSGTKQARHDSALYLDLSSQLLQTVKQTVPSDLSSFFSSSTSTSSSGTSSSSEVTHEVVGQLGIAQSALLGLDILARQFSSSKEWAGPMTETLGELAGMVQAVTDTVLELPPTDDSHSNSPVSQEVFKLLGSFYLCCGTLCSAAKIRSLPFLESLLGRMLSLIEVEGGILLQCDVNVSANTSASSRVQCRTLTLLIRSCVSAVACIVTDLSSFFHPYLPRFLEAVTPLQSLRHIPDATLLGRDIEQCLFVITTKVPSRLSIPSLLQTSLTIFTNKKENSPELLHATAAKLASFQFSTWETLDRSSVTSHLDTLQSISLVGLNYRYTSGDQSVAGDKVDTEVCRACVEFCLKLTETELRAFLLQLVDMKSHLLVDNEATVQEKYSDWRLFSRSVVFFQLLSGLNSKLKHIFVPLMGLVWQGAADHLATLIDFVTVVKPTFAGDGYGDNDVMTLSKKSKGKGKKRKHVDVSSASASSSSSLSMVNANGANSVTAAGGTNGGVPVMMQQKVLRELVTGSNWVLKSVRKCCLHDNVNFIDQFQYETMMPHLSALYAMRDAFHTDTEYLTFAGDMVLPCIVQLVIAVGKDLLWKSLNHAILVMMRSKHKSVKIASLRGLQKLFLDVGEEYLILLPECLPFLSEILEDSDSGVVALASEVIQSIEDMSGESLDSYLR